MSAPAANANPPQRVLLIADDPLAGNVLAEQLTIQGHEVHWARDTIEARWLWHARVYDVIVVDLRKDSSSGTGFIHRIKAEFPEQKIAYVSEIERRRLSGKPAQVPVLRANSTSTVIQMRRR